MCHVWNLKQKVKLEMKQREEEGSDVDGIKGIVSYGAKFVYGSVDLISPVNILNSSFHFFGGKGITIFQPNGNKQTLQGLLAPHILSACCVPTSITVPKILFS